MLTALWGELPISGQCIRPVFDCTTKGKGIQHAPRHAIAQGACLLQWSPYRPGNRVRASERKTERERGRSGQVKSVTQSKRRLVTRGGLLHACQRFCHMPPASSTGPAGQLLVLAPPLVLHRHNCLQTSSAAEYLGLLLLLLVCESSSAAHFLFWGTESSL